MHGGNVAKDQCRREKGKKESLAGTHDLWLRIIPANHQSCGSLHMDNGMKTLTIEGLQVLYEPWGPPPPSITPVKAGSTYRGRVRILRADVCFQKISILRRPPFDLPIDDSRNDKRE